MSAITALTAQNTTGIRSILETHHIATFHNYAYEAIKSIPDIIASMDDMQGENCCEAIKMRKDRNPHYSTSESFT